MPLTTFTLLVGVSALGVNAIRHLQQVRRLKILKVTAGPGGDDGRAAADDRVGSDPRDTFAERLQSLYSGRDPRSGDNPLPPVPLFDGNAFLGKVQATTSLSDGQRERLTRTLELASKIQGGIDATDDPRARYDLEKRLADQVWTRLQMILPKEGLAMADQIQKGPVAFRFGGAR